MKILFNGCSWTNGAELKKPLETRYSKIVGDYFKAEETNIARNGSSNYAILTRTLSQLKKEKYDTCIIQLSFFNRLSLPYKNQIVVTTNRSQVRYENGKIVPGDDYVLKYIQKTNTNLQIYFEYYNPILTMFNGFCANELGIKPIYFFIDNDSFTYFTDILLPEKWNIASKPMVEIVGHQSHANSPEFPRRVPFGPGHHPLEEGHELLAKELIIPEIEKRLK